MPAEFLRKTYKNHLVLIKANVNCRWNRSEHASFISFAAV